MTTSVLLLEAGLIKLSVSPSRSSLPENSVTAGIDKPYVRTRASRSTGNTRYPRGGRIVAKSKERLAPFKRQPPRSKAVVEDVFNSSTNSVPATDGQ